MAIQHLSKGFKLDDWTLIEKKIDDYGLKVIKCLILLGNSDNYVLDNEHNIIGDEYYKYIRKKINTPKMKLVNMDIEIPIIEPTKKVDKIRLENTLKKLDEQINNIIKSFNTEEFNPNTAIYNDIIEFKGIGLMYSGWFLCNNDMNFETIYSIIVIIQKFIHNTKNIKGINKYTHDNKEYTISEILINDINYWLKELLKKYEFNGFVIYKHCPKLLVYTDYDIAVPSLEIRPKQHQIKLLSLIADNMLNGFLIIYNAMIGSGKTTAIVAIAQQIIKLRIHTNNNELKLIFACNLESVKMQGANICYNANIPFAIGTLHRETKEVYIQKHFNCKGEDKNIIVIITSPYVACKLLANCIDNKRYILYLDEPTIGADDINSDMLYNNIELLTYMPERTILSSATFPNVEEIKVITDIFKKQYTNAKILSSYSDEIQIGCDVKTFDNNIIIPHMNIETKNELRKVINKIITCPFLGRIYTINILKELYEAMKKNNIPITNVYTYIENINNMSANNIRKLSYEYLNILEKELDDIIKNVCKINKENNNTIIKFELLGTSQSYLMLNQTLITTLNPVDFALTMFNDLIKDIYDTKISINNEIIQLKNLKNIINRYEIEKSIFEKKQNIQEITDATKKHHGVKKNTIENGNIKHSKKEQKMNDFEHKESAKRPILIFPEFGQINTKQHLNRYAKDKIYNSNFIRIPLNLEELIDLELNVSDTLITLLLCGVGIYSLEHKGLSMEYNHLVLNLASQGKLAYLISDNSICYGTNYPINRVIITDDYVEKHSVNTLYQLMGRAGRVGKSWTAEIYISNLTGLKIIDINQINIEAININEKFIEL